MKYTNAECEVCGEPFWSRFQWAICETCRKDPEGMGALKLVMNEPPNAVTPLSAERLIEEWKKW